MTTTTFPNPERLLASKKLDDPITNAPPWNQTMTGRVPVCVDAGANTFSDKQSSEIKGFPGKNCVFCGHEGPYWSAEYGVKKRAF